MDSGPAPRGASRNDGGGGTRLITRMPASVLAAIGGGALLAADGGGAVVVGIGPGQWAGPVIMEVAEPRDMVADDVVMMVMAVVVPANRVIGGLRRDRRGDQHAGEKRRG